MAWVRRFGFHLAAAVGATGVFVVAAAVGANQTQNAAMIPASAPASVTASPGPAAARRAQAKPTPVPQTRSMAGTVRDVSGSELELVTPRGVEQRIVPAPGALIRLNGKAAKLDALAAGDQVTVFGQSQGRERFMAQVVLARRPT
jgi:hypothetical protein